MRKYTAIAADLEILERGLWDDWTVEALTSWKDSDAAQFSELQHKIDEALVDRTRSRAFVRSVEDYVRSTASELLEERSSIENGKRRSFKVWDLQIELPVERLLLGFLSIFLLSESLVRILRAHLQTRMIRLASIEFAIRQMVGRRWGGVALGDECFNSRAAIDYVLKRDWDALFENEPNFFVGLFYTATSWSIAMYIFVRSIPLIAYQPLAARWVAGGGAVAAGLVVVLSILVSSRLVRKARVTARRLLHGSVANAEAKTSIPIEEDEGARRQSKAEV